MGATRAAEATPLAALTGARLRWAIRRTWPYARIVELKPCGAARTSGVSPGGVGGAAAAAAAAAAAVVAAAAGGGSGGGGSKRSYRGEVCVQRRADLSQCLQARLSDILEQLRSAGDVCTGEGGQTAGPCNRAG